MYTVDGLPPDGPNGSWTLLVGTGVRGVPARRAAMVELPGVDGVLPDEGAPFMPGALTLRYRFMAGTHAGFMGILERFNGVFGQPRMLTITHDFGDGQKRQAQGMVVSEVNPDLVLNTYARYEVELMLPSPFWRSPETVESVVNITGTQTTSTLSEHAGSTGPINDALLRFKGPFSKATVTDPVSGDSVSINQTLTAGQYAVVGTAKWVARLHTQETWATTGGTDMAKNVISNKGAGPMFTLNPDFNAGAGRLRIAVKGTGLSGSPSVTVRAKRSFI